MIERLYKRLNLMEDITAEKKIEAVKGNSNDNPVPNPHDPSMKEINPEKAGYVVEEDRRAHRMETPICGNEAYTARVEAAKISAELNPDDNLQGRVDKVRGGDTHGESTWFVETSK